MAPILGTYRWVRGTELDGGGITTIARVVRLVLLSFFIAWPYGLTTLGMRWLGFADASAWSRIAAWTAEGLWIAVVAAALFFLLFSVPDASDPKEEPDS